MVGVWRALDYLRRDYYVFGGEDAAGSPVAPDLWRLGRQDLSVSDINQYVWDKFPAAVTTPPITGRSGAAAAYSVDSGLLVLVGGDLNGSAGQNGLTDEIWVAQVKYIGNPGSGVAWSHPTMHAFPQHPGPPAISGMKMIALGDGEGRITRSIERFTPSGTSSPGDGCTETLAGQWQTVSDPLSDSERAIADYPFMFQLPDGRMFYAGPSPGENPANAYRRFYDLSTRRWGDSSDSRQDAHLFGSAVMYRPGQILRAGTHSEGFPNSHGISSTETITIGAGATPDWVYYDTLTVIGQPPHPKLLERTNHNLTLLPTGDVLASGGLGINASDVSQPVQQPQIWQVASGSWSDPRLSRNEWLESDPYIRNYHSTAILLPDARILTAGGEAPNPNETTASVFEPPYLFRSTDSLAARPQVAMAPNFVTYGRTFTVTLTQPTDLSTIRSLALMRPSAVTHGFDQNQRYVPLTFTVASSPTRLLVQAPADASTTPPGDYMLFVVNNLATDAPAVPSVAWWTRAGTFTPQPDPADVLPPGTVVDLTGCPHADQSSGELSWTEPADDWFVAASGNAVSYDLRYKVGSTSPDTSDWATGWTPVPALAPGSPGGYTTLQVTGLSPETKYWFRLKTTDDNSHVSALSNAALIWTKAGLECGGGSSAGGGGGGGFLLGLVAGDGKVLAPGGRFGYENSMLDAAPSGVSTSDALRLPVGGAGGLQSFWFRTHDGHSTAFDRARVRIVEHAVGEEAYVADTVAIVGTPQPIAGAAFTDGRTLSSTFQTAAGGPVRALPGDTLDVDLGTNAGPVLVVGGRSLGGRGAPDAMGFDVVSPTADGGWSLLGHRCLRGAADRLAVPGISGTRVRLVFSGAAELASLIGLAPAAGSPKTTTVALASAENAGLGDVTALASAADGACAWLVDRDTLELAFELPPAPMDAVRDVFLDVTGVNTSRAVAQANRALEAHLAPPVPRPTFALRQNQPNPSSTGTEILFELPERQAVRLEIFDSQGRKVREFAGRYDAGPHRIAWDLRTNRGHGVPPGIYAYRLVAGPHEAVLKLVVLP
jgi:hypothetical protein